MDVENVMSSIAGHLDKEYVNDYGLVEKHHDSIILWTKTQKFVVRVEEVDVPEDYYQE